MKITKIEIGESCFGGIARVDGIDVVNNNEDDNSKEIESQALQNEVLTLLFKHKHNLSIADWSLILDMIVQTSKDSATNEYIFVQDEQESYSDSCEQCGNYNHLNVYNKI